jgi:hypothetical protein
LFGHFSNLTAINDVLLHLVILPTYYTNVAFYLFTFAVVIEPITTKLPLLHKLGTGSA